MRTGHGMRRGLFVKWGCRERWPKGRGQSAPFCALLDLELHRVCDRIARDLEVETISAGRVAGRLQVESVIAARVAEVEIGVRVARVLQRAGRVVRQPYDGGCRPGYVCRRTGPARRI